MNQARPSRTALHVAMRRAAHQMFDAPPLVFNDPIAIPILGPYAQELQRTPGRNPAYKPRPHSIGLRAFLIARSRYAEDLLAKAVHHGVTQYVLLGAGLDTFAHRNPFPQLRVFEMDHPATQQWKRDLLRASALPSPQRLTYVPMDFESHLFAAQLYTAGFDSTARSFFAWLGVVPYLTLDAFRSTLAFIASQPHGSGVVFDYSQPRASLSPLEQLAHDSLASRVQLAGESFRSFFSPCEIAEELAAFNKFEDMDTPEINSRYFAQRSDNLRVLGSAGHIVSAWL